MKPLLLSIFFVCTVFQSRDRVPFQLQLSFKTRESKNVTRIITQQKRVTTSRYHRSQNRKSIIRSQYSCRISNFPYFVAGYGLVVWIWQCWEFIVHNCVPDWQWKAESWRLRDKLKPSKTSLKTSGMEMCGSSKAFCVMNLQLVSLYRIWVMVALALLYYCYIE